MSKVIEALVQIVENSISEDFWSEDSILVDAYADENSGDQLDCDMRSTERSGVFANKLLVTIGDVGYAITVESVHRGL